MSFQDEIRAKVTEKIVAALKSGQTPPWRKPWATYGPKLPTSIAGHRYSGINAICLMLAAMQKDYAVNLWGTFNAFRQAGKVVRRGEKGTQIILWKPITRRKLNAKGEEVDDTFPVMKTWTVFNVAQVDGYPLPGPDTARPEFVDYAPAEEAVAATGADIRFGGSRAFYSPSTDHIQMPPKPTFESVNGYYSTLLHEVTHWAQPRLGWKSSYALEELVAELGGTFLSAELGVPNSEDLSNCEAYCASWIKELENDHGAVFKAAKQASASCEFILGFSRKAESEEGEEAGELVAAQ
jgi:antirestriction protein ArdC